MEINRKPVYWFIWVVVVLNIGTTLWSQDFPFVPPEILRDPVFPVRPTSITHGFQGNVREVRILESPSDTTSELSSIYRFDQERHLILRSGYSDQMWIETEFRYDEQGRIAASDYYRQGQQVPEQSLRYDYRGTENELAVSILSMASNQTVATEMQSFNADACTLRVERSSSSGKGTDELRIMYDDSTRISRIDHFSHLEILGHHRADIFAYDNLGRMIRYQSMNPDGGELRTEYVYEYNDQGLVSQMDEYQIVPGGELRSHWSYEYKLDNTGNWVVRHATITRSGRDAESRKMTWRREILYH